MVLRVLLLAFLVLTFGAHLAVAASVGTRQQGRKSSTHWISDGCRRDAGADE